MIWLITIFILILVPGLLIQDINTNDIRKRQYLMVVFSAMTIIAGFRATSVGIDSENYAYSFSYIYENGIEGVSNLTYKYELGYLVLTYLLSRIYSLPALLFLTIACTTYGLFARTIYKYSKDVVMSSFLFAIYFFPSTMNTMRQYLALSIILAAIPFIEKKKPINYLLVILLASTFHNTAILFAVFVVFALKKIHISTKVVAIASIVSIASLYFFDQLLSLFLRYFNQYERFMSSIKYSGQSSIDYFWITFYIVVALIYYFYAKNNENKYKVNDTKESEEKNSSIEIDNLFCILFIISIVCMVFSSHLWIATRINSYFRFSMCFIFPICAKYINEYLKRYRIFFNIWFYAFFSYLGYYMLLTDGHRILPYLFFWDK